jgi:hypothetical protein
MKGCDVRYWYLTDNPTAPAFVRYWSNDLDSLSIQAEITPTQFTADRNFGLATKRGSVAGACR